MGFRSRCGQKWLDSAPYKYSAECASSYVSSYMYENRYTHVINNTYKKVSRYESETQQEVGYFEFSRHILCHFCHFQVSYFNELLPEIIRMNTKIGHCNLKPFVTLNCEDLEFSSEGVSVASCQILMFRHETGSCYISGILCPICHQTSHV